MKVNSCCNSFDDIGCYQNLSPRRSDRPMRLIAFSILLRHWASQMNIRGPGDASDDNEHAKDFDPASDHLNS
jgi:hypothetical protein